MSEAKELVALPPKETALAVYSATNGLDPYLQQVRAKVDEFNANLPDLRTEKSRKQYASMAYSIAQFKGALDGFGKELSTEQKKIPKLIDAERKRAWDTLEAWQKEVRKPLDDWLAKEELRKNRLKDDIEQIKEYGINLDRMPSADLEIRIAAVEGIVLGDLWQEFEVDAARTKDSTLNTLRGALTARKQYEADQAELAQRRADDEARERREHDERVAREATERAQREADAAVQAERDAAARREQDLLDQAEESRRAAAQAETDRIAAEERADQERKDSEARAERAAEEARQAEITRQRNEEIEQKRLAEARAADKAHRAKINTAALNAFIAGGMTDESARQAVTLIVQRKIPAINIAY